MTNSNRFMFINRICMMVISMRINNRIFFFIHDNTFTFDTILFHNASNFFFDFFI
ncbi:Uncharacterised protein [Mycobacterium tuberculosis]|nr:Uncharacterised protein [Mycobacterium tuberculosis]